MYQLISAIYKSKVDKSARVDKLDIDKLKSVPTNLSNLNSKVDRLDIGN